MNVEYCDVVEDIVEDIADEPAQAIRWVTLAMKALPKEFKDAWRKAYFPPEDVGNYKEWIASEEHEKAIADIERMLEKA